MKYGDAKPVSRFIYSKMDLERPNGIGVRGSRVRIVGRKEDERQGLPGSMTKW